VTSAEFSLLTQSKGTWLPEYGTRKPGRQGYDMMKGVDI